MKGEGKGNEEIHHKDGMKLGSCVAALAVMATTFAANSPCVWFSHQEELPEDAKKLRRF